jgi:hypothetical protein
MYQPMAIVIVAMALLQLKHFLCDFVFQTQRHLQFKGQYGHPRGIEHSVIHAAASMPCLLLVGVAPTAALIAVSVEFVIHYHEDWLKEQIVRRNHWTTQDKYFWVAIGADQLVHQITYLGMIFFVLA